VEVLEAAIEEADARGYRVLAMRAATNLGRAYTGMGALTTARRWLADGLARARTLGNVTGQAWGQALLGELERQAGALGEAAVRYERSIELFERVGNAANRLYLRSALAHIALAGGRAEEAESTGLAILAEAVAVDDPDAVVEFVELVAEARAAGDDPEVVTAAVRLLGAAEARRLVLGIPREPVDQPDRDAAVDRAVACLGRSAVAEALAAGADRPWSAVLEDVADPLAPRVSGPRPASA
jgi:hypothetical protein